MWFMGELPRDLGFLQDLLPSSCHSVLSLIWKRLSVTQKYLGFYVNRSNFGAFESVTQSKCARSLQF